MHFEGFYNASFFKCGFIVVFLFNWRSTIIYVTKFLKFAEASFVM